MEKFVGIKSFSTETMGLGGRIKTFPSDFQVSEITSDGRSLEVSGESEYTTDITLNSGNKRFTAFTLVKKNLDTIFVAREIARALRISYNDVSWAGLKDNRAITAQEMCVFGDHKQSLEGLDLKNVEIRNIHYRNHQIHVGELWGNHFKIKIRHLGYDNQGNAIPEIHNMSQTQIKELIRKTTSELKKRGFPNFFGLQRFGSYRPNSHLMGKLIFQKRYKEALDEFLISTYPREHEGSKKIRKRLAEEGDYQDALRYFPHSLRYERAIIEKLASNPQDKRGALKQIPDPLLKLILSAYQSYLFNMAISKRQSELGSINKLVDGDIIAILVDECGPSTPLRYKYGSWYDDALKKALRLRRASITCPILGTETKLAASPFHKIYEELLAREDFRLCQFNCNHIINLGYGGTDRAIYVIPRELKAVYHPSETLDDSFLELEFSLPKGTYATMLVREYCKK